MNTGKVGATPSREELTDALTRGVTWLERTQEKDGSWPGNYGGPLFLLPLFVATCRIIEEPIEDDAREKMLAYLFSVQNPDGGFGLHVEGPSTVYGSVANYVAMRLLGARPNEPRVARANDWIRANGGPVGSASWGKFFLALLDLYPYEGLNPIPPELWLLPETLPVHPSRLWCHCRMVYLPMSYLYRRRFKWQGADLVEEIRQELYPGGYNRIDWQRARSTVHPSDNLTPQSPLAKMAHQLLRLAEAATPQRTTEQALRFVVHQIDREDKNTNYICIGPINKLLNTLVWFIEDPQGPELASHRERLTDYLDETELPSEAGRDTGILMQGYNSSRLWDTTFAVQALVAAQSVVEETRVKASTALVAAARYIDANQVREDVCDKESAYRHASRGGWPFSDRAHGWPISDCTAEGIKATLLLLEQQTSGFLPSQRQAGYPLEDQALEERLHDAVDIVLSLQNEDGGWATYEKTRGPKWLEELNPSDCFREIMIDYSYVECTSACLQAMKSFSRKYPERRRHEIEVAMQRGREFLLSEQRSDGGFEGSWGVCFTYGTWFGIEGLRAAGLSSGDAPLQAARRFLESKQRPDGGWGESVKNCQTRSYDPLTESQVVMTSWAILALLASGAATSPAVSRAVLFLLTRQRPDGTYPNEKIAGVFNKTCAIHYDNYLKIFPVWALAEYVRAHRPPDRP